VADSDPATLIIRMAFELINYEPFAGATNRKLSPSTANATKYDEGAFVGAPT